MRMSANDNPSRRVVHQRIRNRIIESLELASSIPSQREYARRIPNVYVPYEVLNGWDDFVNERTLPNLFVEPVFTSEEREAVISFHDATVMVPIPSGFPPEESVWTSEYWQQLARIAADRAASS